MINDTTLPYKDFKITLIEIFRENARLYNGEIIEWGKVNIDFTTDSDEILRQQYWFDVEPILVHFREQTDRGMDAAPYDSLEAATRSKVVEEKQYYLAFFLNGTEFGKTIVKVQDKLIKDVFYPVIVVLFLASSLLIILGVFRASSLAKTMTQNIILLYETLYEISSEQKGGKKGAVELSYKDTSRELNELHLTFNRVVRTTNLASQSISTNLTKEQLAQSLLSYADAYYIYDEFDSNHS